MSAKRLPEGITARHARACAGRGGRRCNCTPTYQAQVYSQEDQRRLSRSFPTLAAAKGWRIDAAAALRRGTLTGVRSPTVAEAGAEWLEAARSGVALNRSGDRYKPSALRGYEQGLRIHLVPALGSVRLGELRRSDVQRMVNRLMRDGHTPSTIRNAVMPLRVICRWAISLDEIAVNPVAGVQLPAVRGRRDRIADPEEAEALLAALPDGDRALWATALYAGLRLGELRALLWTDVDLAAGVIRVERTWDPYVGPIEPKSRAGNRTVPIPAVLRQALVEHRRSDNGAGGLVFGRPGGRPFEPSGVNRRARRHWEAAGLERIGLHECRHTFASLMIAAGVNPKALSTFMGHASITITLDRYGHLLPGSEGEAAGLLNAFLARSTEARSESEAA
jgi:integrase